MRNIVFIITGLGIGLVASFYYISHSLSSLSAGPPPVTVEHLLSLATYEDLQEVREAKVNELAEILEKITDGPSAREHLPAAQQAFMELGMIDTRISMFPSHPQKPEPMAMLRAQCERLGKSPIIRHEMRSILIPLNSPLPTSRPSPILSRP